MDFVNFLFNNKKYPFNLTLFRKYSDYFTRKIESNDYFLLDSFDSYYDFTDNEINSFIDHCQGKNIEINESNVIGIDYLSQKYQVNSLLEKTVDYIRKNHKKILQTFFSTEKEINELIIEEEEEEKDFSASSKFNNSSTDILNDIIEEEEEEKEFSPSLKFNNLPTNNINETKINNFVKIIPKNVEDIMSFYFVDVLLDLGDILLSLSVSTLYRILIKFTSERKLTSFKQTRDEIEYKIITFLFKYIEKWGIGASILLVILDFDKKGVEYFNEQYNKHREIVDYEIIKTKLFQNLSFIQKKQEEKDIQLTSSINNLKTNQIDQIYQEINKLKLNQEQKLKNEIDSFAKQNKLLQNEIDKMKNEYANEFNVLKKQIENQELQIKYLKFIMFSNYQKIKWPQISLYSFISEIAIPPTFAIIDKKSFFGCSNLQEIIIPSSITKIGDNAFEGCTSLLKIEIPSSVSEIGFNAFSKCSNLSQIKIDFIQTKFQSNSFDECHSLNHIILTSFTGTITDKDYKQLLKQIGNITIITFSSLVTSIKSSAFADCSFLTQINFSPSITQIGDNAFEGCTSLTKLEIPSSVVEIGSYSFSKCTSLTQLTIDLYQTKIQDNSFYECTSLNYIIFSSSSTITSIQGNTFAQFFMNLQNISFVNIPSSVLQLNNYAFNECTTLVEFHIPPSVEKIGDFAFNNCVFLKQIFIPDSVLYIGYHAFNRCASLKKIEIPNSVTKTGDFVLNQCIALEDVKLSESLTCISDHFFNECIKLKQIDIPESVTRIDNNAFNRCTSLTQIQIPESVTKIGDYVFNECTSLTQIQIPKSVTIIGDYIFNECTSLTQIQIPESATKIGDYAFNKCTSLTQIQIPESVTIIGDYAFNECTSLTQIQITKSATKIGDYAVNERRSLKQIDILKSSTKIGDYAFNKCTSLTQIQIPKSVTKIGDYAFNECTSLKQIQILESVTRIGNYTFNNCIALKEIKIPSSVLQFGNYTFDEKQELNSIILEIFKKIIFKGCSSLEHVSYLDYDIEIEKYIDFDDFTNEGNISSSSNSNIYKMKQKSTEKKYAIKVIPSYIFKDIKEFLQIIDLIPNIEGVLHIKGYHLPLSQNDYSIAFDDSYNNDFLKGYVVMTDYMKNGSISSFSNSKDRKMTPTEKSKIIFGISATMNKLHECNFLNIDLRNNKILLDDNLEPKLNILSISKYLSYKAPSELPNCNSIYTAPELLENHDEEYDFPADVYSFSMFLYSIFSIGVFASTSTRVKKVYTEKRPKRLKNIPDNYWDLIQQCWSNNPISRPTFEEITNGLKDDRFALLENGVPTNLDILHEYQKRFE